MTARERLAETLKNPGLVGYGEDETNELIDAFAHELAEQQRAHTGRIAQTRNHAELALVMKTQQELADLIDPHVSAGPVRPGEEPTT